MASNFKALLTSQQPFKTHLSNIALITVRLHQTIGMVGHTDTSGVDLQHPTEL